MKTQAQTAPTLYTPSSSEFSLEEQMLDALELFHYSFGFRDELFVFFLEKASDLDGLMTDLQVVLTSQIHVVVVLENTEEARKIADSCNQTGVHIRYLQGIETDQKFVSTIRKSHSNHELTIAALDTSEDDDLLSSALGVAKECSARKFFYVAQNGLCTIDDRTHYHISVPDLKDKLVESDKISPSAQTLEALANYVESNHTEAVSIGTESGSIYQEIFTYQGRGTLITQDYPNAIRWGSMEDVFLVSRMMKPYIDEGTILPLTEEQLKAQINNFLLYTIDGSIVAGVRMKEYGKAVELSKFFCLPRFRRRGHARQLAEAFIDESIKKDKSYIFCLSIADSMVEFLHSISFVETEREQLPEEWKNHYDFSRPSKAFKYQIS